MTFREGRIRAAGSFYKAKIRSSTKFLATMFVSNKTATIIRALSATVAAERTACTVLEDSTTPRSTRVDSKSRRKAQSPSLTGLLLIMSRLEVLPIRNGPKQRRRIYKGHRDRPLCMRESRIWDLSRDAMFTGCWCA
jgi:hypothetical protein